MKGDYFDKGLLLLLLLCGIKLLFVILAAFDKDFLDTVFSLFGTLVFFVILILVLSSLYDKKKLPQVPQVVMF